MKINVVPKIGEDFKELEKIMKYLNGKLEIQLISCEIEKFSRKIEDFLKKIDLSLLIVHLPSEITDWEVIPFNKEIEHKFMTFVKDCMELSKKYNTHIAILGHLTTKYSTLKYIGFKEWFGFLVRMVQGYDVSFLVENPTTEPYKAKSGEPFIKFVKDFNNEKVRCCFDLCHYKIGKVLYGEHYKLTEDFGKYIFSVHFSELPIKKHIFEDKTHGRRHKTHGDIINDLFLLEDLGINYETVNIVTEINEDDYENKPDLIAELQLIKELNERI